MSSRLVVTAALLLAACVDEGDGPRPGQLAPKELSQHLLAHPPADLTSKADATFGGFVRYLGNTTEAATVIPGDQLVIVHYWQVVKPPGAGWRVLTRVRGDAGKADYAVADRSLMRDGYGPASWHVGDIIQDEQTIVIPPGWSSKTATVTVGLQRVGAHDAASRAQVAGRDGARAGDERMLPVATFTVDLAHAPPPPGTVAIPKTAEPITIDGVAGEQVWKQAAQSLDFVTADKSPDPGGRATAKLLWDDQNLYVFVTSTDPDVYNQYKAHDEPMWKQDVYELFIDADGNGRGYVELQVNPNNATFDKWYQGVRGGPEDLAWSSGIVTAVKVRGTPDVQGDADRGWDAELQVPWTAVKGKDPNMKFPLPPQPGQKLRINVVWVDLKTGAANIAAASWNQIPYSDFHALDRMLDVVLKDDHQAAPAPTPAPAPAPLPFKQPPPP